jgi:glycosyltransferase 2 family protein
MLKTIFLNTLKLVVAGGLIGWLLGSGKLDFKLLLALKDHPFSVALAVMICVINFYLISWRWRNILSARTTNIIPLNGMLKVTWIGQFFSSVLPGSVSGDLIKMLYVQSFDEKFSKKFIFASILIDRVMGLSGLILLVGLSSLFFSSHILREAPLMAPLLKFNFGLAGIVILSLLGFFFLHTKIRLLFVGLGKLFLPQFWQKIMALWDDLTAIRSRILNAVIVSILVQLSGVVIFWSLISPHVSGKMDFIQALAFIPLGLMTLALPVAPSGLGVGHAIFQKLFEFSGIANGASLFNLYFVVTLCVNLIGVIPYLISKRKI